MVGCGTYEPLGKSRIGEHIAVYLDNSATERVGRFVVGYRDHQMAVLYRGDAIPVEPNEPGLRFGSVHLRDPIDASRLWFPSPSSRLRAARR